MNKTLTCSNSLQDIYLLLQTFNSLLKKYNKIQHTQCKIHNGWYPIENVTENVLSCGKYIPTNPRYLMNSKQDKHKENHTKVHYNQIAQNLC